MNKYIILNIFFVVAVHELVYPNVALVASGNERNINVAMQRLAKQAEFLSNISTVVTRLFHSS